MSICRLHKTEPESQYIMKFLIISTLNFPFTFNLPKLVAGDLSTVLKRLCRSFSARRFFRDSTSQSLCDTGSMLLNSKIIGRARSFSITSRRYRPSKLSLAYDLHESKNVPPGPKHAPIIFMHGLFGSKKNNRSISKWELLSTWSRRCADNGVEL